jgi:hypothetical protein
VCVLTSSSLTLAIINEQFFFSSKNYLQYEKNSARGPRTSRVLNSVYISLEIISKWEQESSLSRFITLMRRFFLFFEDIKLRTLYDPQRNSTYRIILINYISSSFEPFFALPCLLPALVLISVS